MQTDQDDNFSRLFRCGYVWDEIRASPKLTNIFNGLDKTLEDFSKGKRGPEGILLKQDYESTPALENMVRQYRAVFHHAMHRKLNICATIDNMLDNNDEFPTVRSVEQGLDYLKKGYGV